MPRVIATSNFKIFLREPSGCPIIAKLVYSLSLIGEQWQGHGVAGLIRSTRPGIGMCLYVGGLKTWLLHSQIRKQIVCTKFFVIVAVCGKNHTCVSMCVMCAAWPLFA